MKKIILLVILCLTLTGCQEAAKQEVDIPFNPNYTLTIELDGESITNTGLSFTVSEDMENPNTYGEWYEIEKFVDNVWLKVSTINTCEFNDVGLQVDDDKSIVFNINWEYCYGALESGEYRIVKYFIPYLERKATEEDREYFYVEFTID